MYEVTLHGCKQCIIPAKGTYTIEPSTHSISCFVSLESSRSQPLSNPAMWLELAYIVQNLVIAKDFIKALTTPPKTGIRRHCFEVSNFNGSCRYTDAPTSPTFAQAVSLPFCGSWHVLHNIGDHEDWVGRDPHLMQFVRHGNRNEISTTLSGHASLVGFHPVFT